MSPLASAAFEEGLRLARRSRLRDRGQRPDQAQSGLVRPWPGARPERSTCDQGSERSGEDGIVRRTSRLGPRDLLGSSVVRSADLSGAPRSSSRLQPSLGVGHRTIAEKRQRGSRDVAIAGDEQRARGMSQRGIGLESREPRESTEGERAPGDCRDEVERRRVPRECRRGSRAGREVREGRAREEGRQRRRSARSLSTASGRQLEERARRRERPRRGGPAATPAAAAGAPRRGRPRLPVHHRTVVSVLVDLGALARARRDARAPAHGRRKGHPVDDVAGQLEDARGGAPTKGGVKGGLTDCRTSCSAAPSAQSAPLGSGSVSIGTSRRARRRRAAATRDPEIVIGGSRSSPSASALRAPMACPGRIGPPRTSGAITPANRRSATASRSAAIAIPPWAEAPPLAAARCRSMSS